MLRILSQSVLDIPLMSFLLSSLDLAYSCLVTLGPLSSSFSSFIFHCFSISLFLLLYLSLYLSIYLSLPLPLSQSIVVGTVVILRNRFEDVKMGHKILTSPIDGIKSHFKTSYGLTVKLLETKTLEECRALIERGFGAYLLQKKVLKK